MSARSRSATSRQPTISLCSFTARYHHVLSSYDDGPCRETEPASDVHELMKYAIAHRYGVFDFTIGDEACERERADQASASTTTLRLRARAGVVDRARNLGAS